MPAWNLLVISQSSLEGEPASAAIPSSSYFRRALNAWTAHMLPPRSPDRPGVSYGEHASLAGLRRPRPRRMKQHPQSPRAGPRPRAGLKQVVSGLSRTCAAGRQPTAANCDQMGPDDTRLTGPADADLAGPPRTGSLTARQDARTVARGFSSDCWSWPSPLALGKEHGLRPTSRTIPRASRIASMEARSCDFSLSWDDCHKTVMASAEAGEA